MRTLVMLRFLTLLLLAYPLCLPLNNWILYVYYTSSYYTAQLILQTHLLFKGWNKLNLGLLVVLYLDIWL